MLYDLLWGISWPINHITISVKNYKLHILPGRLCSTQNPSTNLKIYISKIWITSLWLVSETCLGRLRDHGDLFVALLRYSSCKWLVSSNRAIDIWSFIAYLSDKRTAIELQFAILSKATRDNEATGSCIQAISTHAQIIVDISRNYLEDRETTVSHGIVPIASVISCRHALIARIRLRELSAAILKDDSTDSIILKESLQKKSEVWGLAGTSIHRCILAVVLTQLF